MSSCLFLGGCGWHHHHPSSIYLQGLLVLSFVSGQTWDTLSGSLTLQRYNSTYLFWQCGVDKTGTDSDSSLVWAAQLGHLWFWNSVLKLVSPFKGFPVNYDFADSAFEGRQVTSEMIHVQEVQRSQAVLKKTHLFIALIRSLCQMKQSRYKLGCGRGNNMLDPDQSQLVAGLSYIGSTWWHWQWNRCSFHAEGSLSCTTPCSLLKRQFWRREEFAQKK